MPSSIFGFFFFFLLSLSAPDIGFGLNVSLCAGMRVSVHGMYGIQL